MFGDSTSGQRVLYQLGMTRIPIINVNNNCSTGSTALYQARAAIAAGTAECALALGFERMKRGFITEAFPDRTNPLGKIRTSGIIFFPALTMPHFFPSPC